jgi:Ca2+-binding EF-hand superfamily protein
MSGDQNEKLKIAFDAFDSDHSGSIELGELVCIHLHVCREVDDRLAQVELIKSVQGFDQVTAEVNSRIKTCTAT